MKKCEKINQAVLKAALTSIDAIRLENGKILILDRGAKIFVTFPKECKISVVDERNDNQC